MKTDNLTARVLDSANRVAGTNLSLPPDGDLPLEAFGFDSLTFFAFVLDLGAKLRHQIRRHAAQSRASAQHPLGGGTDTLALCGVGGGKSRRRREPT